MPSASHYKISDRTDVISCAILGKLYTDSNILVMTMMCQNDNDQLDLIRRYNIDYLYHMTFITNFTSIFKYGLLSHNAAHRLVKVADISDSSVQNLRSRIKINNIMLHDYVPLYFSPRNPMLYRRRELQKNIIFLGIDSKLLLNNKTIFSDGNAAASDTKFYRGVYALERLPWHIIKAKYWTDFGEDGKRIKCAEILVYPKIEVNSILKLFCYSEEVARKIGKIIPKFLNIEVNPSLYF